MIDICGEVFDTFTFETLFRVKRKVCQSIESTLFNNNLSKKSGGQA